MKKSANTIEVAIVDIGTAAQAALVAHGASLWVAQEVAKAIVVAESKGNLICGLYYLESYCQQLLSGRVDGTVEPIISSPKPATVYADAKFGFAQAAFAKALPSAIASVQTQGICSLAIAHAHTCTSLGYFTEQIAQSGYIAIGFTNASAVVSPPNGNKAVLGTNPIAMSIPAQDGGIAFQFDQSTSAVALGKITMAKAAGTKIPLGWAVDKDGKATDDPEAALQGSLVSSGGYKGWGFGLMAEILAAGMTGSVNSLDVSGLKLPAGKPHDLGQYYLLIDSQVHAGDEFWQRLARVTEAIAEQPEARLPGANFVAPDSVQIDPAIWKLTLELGEVISTAADKL